MNYRYQVTVSIPYPYPGETYVERFVMEGNTALEVTRRVRIMLGDPRYLVAVRAA